MVTVTETPRTPLGIRVAVVDGAAEIGRAFLYVMYNDLHAEPFGFLEDVFVDERHRRRGVGAILVEQVVATAKAHGCYKLIATSRIARSRVHEMYERLGFSARGIEFRMDLSV